MSKAHVVIQSYQWPNQPRNEDLTLELVINGAKNFSAGIGGTNLQAETLEDFARAVAENPEASRMLEGMDLKQVFESKQKREKDFAAISVDDYVLLNYPGGKQLGRGVYAIAKVIRAVHPGPYLVKEGDDHFTIQISLEYLPGWAPRFVNGKPSCESFLGNCGISARPTVTHLTDDQWKRVQECIGI
jgi:hypothetical protein